MAENANGTAASSQRLIIQLIWAVAAVAIVAMIVFVLPGKLLPQQPGFQQQAQGQPYPYPPQEQAQPVQPIQAAPPAASEKTYSQEDVENIVRTMMAQQQQTQPQQPAQQQQAQAQPQPAPTPPADPLAASARPLSDNRVDSGYEVTDPKVASDLLSILGAEKAAASVADIPSGLNATPQNTIYAFVDPRCPHCQNAHRGLSGKYAIKYMPISVLGDEQTMNEALPGIRGVLRQQNRAAALNRLMEGSSEGLDTAPDEKMDQQIADNTSAWWSLGKRLPDQQPAVPLFVIPEATGKVVVVKGWRNDMPAVLNSLMKR